MDNFEKHIRDNAAQFDGHKADRVKLWAKISKELEAEAPQVAPTRKFPIVKMVAAIVLFFAISGFVALTILKLESDRQTRYASKELSDIDMHYKGLVSYQVTLVQNHTELSDGDKAEFLSFMDELDMEYQQLRLEMRKNLDNELVLEAIVSNYKQRIELIEKLLKQINESKIQDNDHGYTL